MEKSFLIKSYPKLYHITHDGSWSKIRKLGLLSTTALLDKLGTDRKERFKIESKQRPESVVYNHPKFGTITFRDQKPLPLSKLRRCVKGCTVPKYLRLLNRKVFFWTDLDRVKTLMNGRAYRESKQELIILDTAKLLDANNMNFALCHKNSGQLTRMHTLSPSIFKDIDSFESKPNRKGKPNRKIVEFTVEYSVLNIKNYVIEVRLMRKGRLIKKLFP